MRSCRPFLGTAKWMFLAALLLVRLAGQTVPGGGQPLVNGDLALQGSFYGGSVAGGAVAELQRIDTAGPTFTQAARVDVKRPNGEFYSAALFGTNNRALANQDVVLLRFWMRAVQTMDETGAVFVQVYAEGPGPAYTKSLSQQVSAGPEWTEYLLPFEVNGSYNAGDFRINFGFGAGDRPRILDLGGVEVWWYGKDRRLEDMPRTAYSYEGRAADAPWRAAAAARIEEYRKSEYVVRVVDEGGQPVSGARVRVRLRRHAFAFGTAFQAQRVVQPSSPDDENYRTKLVELFNAGSTENDLKWPAWEGNWGGGFSRAQTLASLQWLRDRGFQLRGHVLVWPSARNLPESIKALLPTRDASIPQRVRTHIADVVSATEPWLDEWDVLNEPYDNKDLMEIFGNEIMTEWFTTAHQYDPTARLYINDYGILSGAGLNTTKQQAYEDTIRFLLNRGAPLHGIGFQGHFESSPTGITRVWSILERYRTAFPQLSFKVTEFDVDTDDEQLQADYTRDFLTLLFSHPSVTGFQFWGFWEGAHWREQAAMYRRDWSEKPSGTAFRELVHGAWKTDETQTADANGTVYGRAFHGEYEVTVTAPGMVGSRRFTLPAGGAETRVVLASGADRSRLVNVSTRGTAGIGDNVMIAGFVLRGGGEKPVVIRGVGPKLADYGVTGAVLQDPELKLVASDESDVAENDSWEPALAADFEAVGAFPLQGDTRSAALRLDLPAGHYTAQVGDRQRTGTGVALVEVYDAATDWPMEMINLSTRGPVGTGANVMIGGFSIRGSAPKRVLIRGVGPGLAEFLSGFLPDPVCTVYRQGNDTPVAVNDNWGTAPELDDLKETTARLTFPLAEGSRDAALLLTLEPGNYTVHIAGANDTTGIALFEVYDAD